MQRCRLSLWLFAWTLCWMVCWVTCCGTAQAGYKDIQTFGKWQSLYFDDPSLQAIHMHTEDDVGNVFMLQFRSDGQYVIVIALRRTADAFNEKMLAVSGSLKVDGRPEHNVAFIASISGDLCYLILNNPPASFLSEAMTGNGLLLSLAFPGDNRYFPFSLSGFQDAYQYANHLFPSF